MKRYVMMLLLFLAVGLFVLQTTQTGVLAKEDGEHNKSVRLSKTLQGGVNRTLVNVGNIAMWIYSDGTSANEPDGDSGWYFPRGRGTLTAAIFQDGFIWGGQVNDGVTPRIRVGGQTYSIGTVPGKIISPGVAESKADPDVNRIWRVRRDYATADLALDASEVFETTTQNVTDAEIAQVRTQYKEDWIDWPAERGAPFYDVDGDGQYTPGFRTNAQGIEVPKLRPVANETFNPALHADEPGVGGADQVVWLVANDLDRGAVQTLYGSPSIGFEMQCTLWAYRRADALGNIVFKQFRIIYKGSETTPANATIDSLYFCQWSDPDLGDAGDDFVGCDTTLSLGYCYNASANDRNYAGFGLPPPASGYDFFAGPLVEDPGGVAIFGLKPRPGFRNLPMSSFAFFAAGGQDSDPTRGGDYNGTLQWWNLLRGFRPRPENPAEAWTDPSGNRTYFRVPGDPVSGQGWIDENAGDRRLLMVSGPFTMAVGDTQETVLAALSALGSDRLSSISVLKFVDRFAQEAFDNLFVVPSPPETPRLSATELDGEVLLNWGGNPDAVAATEETMQGVYRFEGYNVYQLPTAGSTVDQGIRLATFDTPDDPTVISQETFDASSGLVLNLPVQFGTNSGITRTLVIDSDRFRDTDLINGQVYFFGVTAYSVSTDPDATVKTLESPAAVVTVRPQFTKPGTRFQAAIGDTLPAAAHVEGASDGGVTIIVTDPSKLTGDDYTVTFSVDTTGGANIPLWHLTNTTTGEILLANQTNQSGNANYLPTEGFTAIVLGAPNGFKNFLTIANGAGPIDPPTGAAAEFQGFPTPERPGASQQVGSGVWMINAGGGDGSYGSFLGRSLRGDNFDRVVPFDWEMRFTARGSWAVKAFNTGEVVKVPFELWNIGSNTPDDPSDDVRLIPWFLDNAEVGGLQTDPNGLTFQLDPNDHPTSGGTNDPYTPWIYWRIPVDDSPGEAGYNAFTAAIDTTLFGVIGADASGTYDYESPEAFARMVLVSFNGDEVSDGVVEPGTQMTPEEGTIFRIISTKPNTPADRFTFSTAGFEPTSNDARTAEDVLALANVFPNPYYGFNSRETSSFSRFVTFSHLPQRAIIRIFNMAGALVRAIDKNDATQFATWNLQNESELPVASGIYIAHIEFPELGISKNLKLAIIQEQQFLPRF